MTTLGEVRDAKAALEAEGVYASYDKVRAIVGGSKRDIGAYMRQLATETPAPEPHTPDALAASEPSAGPVVSPEVVASTDSFTLLAAFHACEAAAEVERRLGEEHGRVKAEHRAISQPIAMLEFQQRQAHDDDTVLRLGQELQTRVEQARASEEALSLLQERRRQANALMVSAYQRFATLQHQAQAAIRSYRVAREASEHDPNAYVRSQAKIGMSTAYQVLESLVGPDETMAVLADGATPAWLR